MIVILDASRMTDKDTTHVYLKEVLDLPEYYGNNLDALHDCLEEMNHLQIRIVNEEKAGDYYKKVRGLLEDVKQGGD